MTTIRVSSTAALNTALKSAQSGDTVLLASGNYGKFSLSNFDKDITIASADPGKPAVFNKVGLSKVSNVTFDGIKFDYDPAKSGSSAPFSVVNSSDITIRNADFDGHVSKGYGTGTGLTVRQSSDVIVEQSEFHGFYKALQVWAVDDMAVVKNDFDNIAYDAMVFGHVRGLLVDGNKVEMHAVPGVDHKDTIQIYNQGPRPTSSDIIIRNNELSADDGMTHGIYMGNHDAKATGSTAEFYKNVLIENNTITTGQKLGIAVGETVGLVIRNNTVLQHEDMNSNKVINTPMILVAEAASKVTITGNTGHANVGSGDDNWQSTGAPKAAWTIANNKIVKLGTSADDLMPVAPAPVKDAVPAPIKDTAPEPVTPAPNSGDGDADVFRFLGDKMRGHTYETVKALDFSDGDIITLGKYQRGTFEDVGGGNVLNANKEGTYVKIDSLTDIQELDFASKAITTTIKGDALVINIAQSKGVQHITLEGLGEEYRDSFDSLLF